VKRHHYKLSSFSACISVTAFLLSVNVLCAKATDILKADQNMTGSIAL